MRWQLGVFLMFVLTVVAPASGEDVAVPELHAFLSVPVTQRLKTAVAAGDFRFLAVYDYTLQIPGVPPNESHRVSKRGVLKIPGTSDALVSEEHSILNERARAYAKEYNALLLRQLTWSSP